MPRNIDPVIGETLKKYGFGKEAVWDCHGTWVIYHHVLEKVAIQAGIKIDAPIIVEANSEKGIAAVCVTGHLDAVSIWSIGEAAPKNNKNAYCWAMAEKRAIDRVILKLIGLNGLVYSEEEADTFKQAKTEHRPQDAGQNDLAMAGPFQLFDTNGEVENVYENVEDYLKALGNLVKDKGAYWISNEHVVDWLQDQYGEQKIGTSTRSLKDWCNRLRKLGKDGLQNTIMGAG